MRILLIANTIFEIGVGIVFLFFPGLVLKDTATSISLLRIIGCGALAFGTLSFLMLNVNDIKSLQPGLVALCIFHTLATLSQFYSFRDGRRPGFAHRTANIPATIAHFLFAISFIGILWQQFR